MQIAVILRRAVIVLNVIAAFTIIALGVHVFVQPLLITAIYGPQYENLVARCDMASKDRLLVKAQLPAGLTREAKMLSRREADEQRSCAATDSMRGRLLSLGLTENDLSELGVQAMENKEPNVSAFVQIHQFKY